MKSFKNVNSLYVESSVKVVMENSNKVDDITLELENGDLENEFNIYQTSKGELRIVSKDSSKQTGGVQISSDGMFMSVSGNATGVQTVINRSGRNINISSGNYNIGGATFIGDVYVNGVKVDSSVLNNQGKVEETKANLLRILIPTKLIPDLEVSAKHFSDFDCSAEINQGTLEVLNGGNISINKVKKVSATIKGSGDITVKDVVDVGVAVISGSGDIDINGSMNSLNCIISGSGDITSYGKVKETFIGVISGSGDIRHIGTITGHVIKTVSGSGSIII